MKTPISYRIYTEIQKEEVIWTVEIRCTGDVKYIMPVQRSRNNRGRSVCRPCVYVREHSAKDKRFQFHGLPEREESRKEESEGVAF